MGLLDPLFGIPSRRQFAQLLIRSLENAGDPRSAVYDADRFQLRFSQEGQDAGIANLHNIYEEYARRGRAERKPFLRSAVLALLAPHKKIPEEFQDARPDILPTVRPRAYFSLMELQSRTEGNGPLKWPYQPLADHLALGLVYDLPEAMMMLQQQQLDEWEISLYEGFEVARQNLSEIDFSFAGIDKRLYVSATGDNYDSARLIWLDLIRSLEVDGDYIAMIPNRDLLLVTGADDDEGLSLMLDMATEALQAPRPMSGLAFRLVGDDWDSWLPAVDHPLFDRFNSLAIRNMAQVYGEQGDLLTRLHGQAAGEPRVAEFAGLKHRETGRLVSYCLWSGAGDALLPKADYVFFHRAEPSPDGRVVASAPWSKALDVVGHLMEEQDLYPVRYRVREFPAEAQLQRLGNCIGELS